MVWLLGIGQGLDALVTFVGVKGGWLVETNIVIAGMVVSPFFILLKGSVGVWCGRKLKGSNALLVFVLLTMVLVVWNVSCLTVAIVFPDSS